MSHTVRPLLKQAIDGSRSIFIDERVTRLEEQVISFSCRRKLHHRCWDRVSFPAEIMTCSTCTSSLSIGTMPKTWARTCSQRPLRRSSARARRRDRGGAQALKIGSGIQKSISSALESNPRPEARYETGERMTFVKLLHSRLRPAQRPEMGTRSSIFMAGRLEPRAVISPILGNP